MTRRAAGAMGLSFWSVTWTVSVTVAERKPASPTTRGTRRAGVTSLSKGVRVVMMPSPLPASPSAGGGGGGGGYGSGVFFFNSIFVDSFLVLMGFFFLLLLFINLFIYFFIYLYLF